MTDKDQKVEDGYQIPVRSDACFAFLHSQCTGYCECGCHQ